MDFRSLHYATEAFLPGAVRAVEIGSVIGDNDIALTSGTWLPPSLIRFRQYEGRKLLDCVGTQRATIKLVSEKVVNALRDAQATGWDVFPVGLDAKDGGEIRGYHGLVVNGRCGALDDSRSKPVRQVAADNPQRSWTSWMGMFFDDESWDRRDIFRPSGTGYIFVTTRVLNALEGVGVTNLKFVPLADVERLLL